MSIGCVIKGVLIAGVLGLAGYFVAPMLGLNSAVPVGSLFAIGLFSGYLIGALVTWRSGASGSDGKQGNENVLYVGNIPFKAREDEVQRLFEAYGGVKSVRLVRGGPSRRPKGYGFVEMASARDVKEALALNGEEFAGRKLRVNEAKDKK
jgi:RNA recognition motif-containing protein